MNKTLSSQEREIVETRRIKEKKKNEIKFDLKEDTPRESDDSSCVDLDSDGDGLPDPNVDTSDEEVEVFEIDDKTGQEVRSKKLSYKLSKVTERIGCKVNQSSKYYD